MSQAAGTGIGATTLRFALAPMASDPSNLEIAAVFDELADLYELDGAIIHRVMAYRSAAKASRDAMVSVAAMTRQGRVTELPGIGKTLEEKLVALLETGTIPALEKLRAKYPSGLLEMTRLPGLGPKRARRLFTEPGIDSPAMLRAAAEEHRLRGVKGFGPKFEESVLSSLDAGVAERPAQRVLLSRALTIGEQIVAARRDDRRADGRGAARAPGRRARRAGRLGAPPGRLRQGPRHHRHRKRPRRAGPGARRARRDRVGLGAQRARRARADAHRPAGRPARRRAGELRQPPAALH